jgi:cyanophycinase
MRHLLLPVLLSTLLAGCRSAGGNDAATTATGLNGTLLAIGGGLDDDNAPVYRRFVELAAKNGPPRFVIATAASGDEDDAEKGKREAIAKWSPDAKIDAIRRGTPTAETVALVDGATALFFTGGDQKRITDRYRPNDKGTPEWEAMIRLLGRGGVVAGTSAGDAMMGDVMFYEGQSAAALGIVVPRRPREGDDAAESREAPVLGPRIGPGMRMVPWAITDSHFFERNRVGRLVAALETAGVRFGLGVGEDACVEIDLATGEISGTSVAESLLVDVAALRRDGLARRSVRARVLKQGDRLSLTDRLAAAPSPAVARPAGDATDVPVVEPGQNRQLASWRLFSRATTPDSGVRRLALEGWAIVAWPDGAGEVVFDVEPTASSTAR